MSGTPNYASTPLVGAKLLTTADTSRTAPTTFQSLITAPVGGAQVERLSIIPVATTVASVIRFFKYDGASYRLFFEYQLPAQTLAAGTAVAAVTFQAADNPSMFPIILGSNWELRATVNDAQTGVAVHAEGGGY